MDRGGGEVHQVLFGLEKSHGKRKAINKLITPEKEVLFDQQDISDHVVSVFQKLYSSDNPSSAEINNYINSSDLPILDRSIVDEINCDIDICEFDQVVNTLKCNKSPGWYGLSAEFYKEFWPDIREMVFNAVTESISRGTMTPSQRIGIITLIPKPKFLSELCFIKNWRPITLLNTD